MSNPVKQAAEKASTFAGGKLGGARQKVGETMADARVSLSNAGGSVVEKIEDNPASALVGALALGALIGTLLPRTGVEQKALGPIGTRLNTTAKSAAFAAKDAGIDKLAELGITKEAARENAGKLIGNALLAAVTAGDAAVAAARRGKDASVTGSDPTA